MVLPCRNEERVVRQVRPTIDLLTNLDVWHPDVLLQHSIQPADYKGSLVFRSAVESIRGSFIASSTANREALVAQVLEALVRQNYISGYEQTSSTGRYDFTIALQRNPDIFAALEVKGGEGNSINISERPLWAREFGVWCHLDGAIVNQPAHGARAIVARLTNEMVRREKLVDMLFFKDILCGTRARPCPKYIGAEDKMGLQTAPDVFLFPKRIPTLIDRKPPVHTVDSLILPKAILSLFEVPNEHLVRHIWEVHVTIVDTNDGQVRRLVQVYHQGQIVQESASRSWRPGI